MAVFSGYGFNQGQATAYAGVSYRSAYLKAHYPAAFLAAPLQDWGGYYHPALYMAEAVRLGMAVRPPHVNHSAAGFTLAWEGAQPVLWMGLGQVRDMRRQAIQEIIAGRPFADVDDVLTRVALQDKELDHLTRCGALDGLGEHRAALLAAVALARRAGSAQQMAFDFAQTAVVPETLAEQWAWEKRILGYPLRALQAWLPRLTAQYPTATTLQQLLEAPGQHGIVIGVHLPGWGRGGFYMWDGATWALAKGGAGVPPPPVWEPAAFHGRGQHDTWGMAWVQVERLMGAASISQGSPV